MRLTRITLAIIALIISAGFYLLLKRQLTDVEPQIFQATEESMVDTSQFLAALAESHFDGDSFKSATFQEAVERTNQRTFEAKIFRHTKRQVGIDLYVTDSQGIVLYDSSLPKNIGADFSKMRDVNLTLKNQYGARSSRSIKNDDKSSVLHVAAPIGDPKKLLGVLTVYKKQSDVLPIIRERISEIWWGSGLVGAGILFCICVVFIWQYRPISQLTEYAHDIERGERKPLPKLGLSKEVNTLGRALESMRESLEGRQFAEHYVQTLTHEMKSPLAAIRGAAELLNDDFSAMPEEDRRRFLNNISTETQRAERLLRKLLELSVLESQSMLEQPESIDLPALVQRAVDDGQAMADLAKVRILFTASNEPQKVMGDPFALTAAVANLLENAIEFSPEKSDIEVSVHRKGSKLVIIICDRGEGIPEYAREKVFERFFSLRHLHTGRKSTGLGLTLVRESAELHFGTISLEPADPVGTRAILSLPAG